MSQKRPTAGGESCGQDSFVLEEGHAQINRIFVFLYGGRHVDHLVYREYSRACHSDWCLAADRLPAILLWIGMKKSRSRLFRARAVCAAYTSFPRGAHPCGAFYVIGISYHIKKEADSISFFSMSFFLMLINQRKRELCALNFS